MPSTKNYNIHISISSLCHDTDRTERLHKRWIMSVVSVPKMTWFLWLPIEHAVTKQLSQTVMYNARTTIKGHPFRFQKTPVPLTSMTSKSPFPIHANPIASPRSEKKCHANFPQMLHCGSVQRKFLTYFKGACSLPGCLLLSLYHFSSFFQALIPNVGIKEASKSWREADVWWRWHRWNEAHFSPDQPTSLFSASL